MVETANFPKRTLLGLSVAFISIQQQNSNAAEKIGPLWGQMSSLFFNHPELGRENPIGVGAMWPIEGGAAGEMQYFAGYEVSEPPQDLGGLEVLEIPSGDYAFATHRGPLHDLATTVQDFYTNKLPSSKLERRPGMDLEIYIATGEASEVVIAAPVILSSWTDEDSLILFSA